MSTEERKFIEAFKKQLIAYAVVLLLGVISTAVGFYYNTNSAIGATKTDIEELKSNCKIMNDTQVNLQINKVDRSEYREDIKEIKAILEDIRKEQKSNR